jgi:YD repeat-containing protein
MRGSGGSAVVRTYTTSYDAGERELTSSISVTPTGAGGTDLPTVTFGYDSSTGLPTTQSTTSGGTLTSLTTGYNSVGEATSYTDASGVTSTTEYDLSGRPTSVFDGKGTYTYGYDTSAEHRGMLTSEDAGVSPAPGTLSATYDADGNLASESQPNGLVESKVYDNADDLTQLTYTMGSMRWIYFKQITNSQNEIAAQSSALGFQGFTYDGADRLTTVQDYQANFSTASISCTTRSYAYDADSNRLGLTITPDDGTSPSTGHCGVPPTSIATTSSYDQADRLVSDAAGAYGYDALGRTTSVPAGDAQGVGIANTISGNETIGYYTNDFVQSEAQGAVAETSTLDPGENRVVSVTVGATTATNHFASSSDSPAWQSVSGGGLDQKHYRDSWGADRAGGSIGHGYAATHGPWRRRRSYGC